MSHVLVIAAGDFRSRALRYFLTSLAIGVGVALIVALYAVSDATRIYVENTIYKVYPADIMLYSDVINIPQYLIDNIRNIPSVEAAEGIIIATGAYGDKMVTIIGIPLKDVDYFAVDLKEGRLLAAGGEAVVEESLMASVGQWITIKVYTGAIGGERELRVKTVGIIRSFLRGFVGAFRLNLVVVPLDWLQEQLDTGPFINAVLITLRDKGQVKALQAALKERFKDAQVYTQESLLETVSQVFNALNTVFAAISGAAVATGAVTTFAVMSITMRERLREFGLLKAVGISSRDIALSVILEVLIISAAAGIGGIALGFYGANVVRDILVGMGINFNVPITFKPQYVVIGLAVSFAVALAGTATPLIRATRLRPLEIMRLWQ